MTATLPPRTPAFSRSPGASAPPPSALRTPPRRKRAFDLLVAAVLLALTAPLLAGLALGVWWRYGRPVFFRQRREVGRGRSAWIVKLRTLAPCPDPDTRWAVGPQEMTAFGSWLRASHLDELPQLVNVVRGEMSLVGPRPERPYFAERFTEQLPGYAGRLRVPAGMTGWAQVHGLHGDTSIAERARFDNDYIDHWSLRLDLRILARTLAVAIRGLAGTSEGGRR